MKRRWLLRKKAGLTAITILLLGLCLPQRWLVPVQGATRGSYDQRSFWYYPWGKSVTHKGVDIFAPVGTPVLSSTHGIVIYTGVLKMGGNVVLVLGPRWRLYYYAHLNSVLVHNGAWVQAGEKIATVGNSGNAKGKPPHLHYAINTLLPYPWRADTDHQGWKKMFYLNPVEYLNEQLKK